MDLNRIKNLIKHNGDKVVLIENGEPEVVMLSFEEYEKMAQDEKGIKMEKNRMAGPVFRYRAETADPAEEKLEETEFILPADGKISPPPVRLEDIRLEDLPI